MQTQLETQAGPIGAAGWYNRILDAAAAALMALIVIIMVVQVFARYVLNDSLIWAEELCRYLLIWITFLFIGIAFQRGEFIAVDILTANLTPRRRFILKAVVTVPVLVFLWLMVTNGYAYATRFAAQNIPAIDFIWTSLTGAPAKVPIVWVYVSVPIGSGLLLLHMILSLALEGYAVFLRPATQDRAGDGE